MRYSIILSPEAKESLENLKGNIRSLVRDGIIEYLRNEPEKVSKSRIKRLKGVARPQFRLRIDDVRIYYDVSGNTVEILEIVTKKIAAAWLERNKN
jgi:mRNA interferase RelE/StbE